MAMFIKQIRFYVFIAWFVGAVTCYVQNKGIEDDFRFISYKDLLSNGDRFSTPNVTTYSTLLFDVAREQVIVGARDVLYRMSLSLQPREVAVWEATQEMIDFCQRKGQTDKDCRNYIKVLQSYGNQLYACGTYAFSPSCSWRQMENLSVIGYDKGVGKCPFNPNANITTLMTENGKLFVGSPTDFSGSDSAILGIDISQDTSRLLRSQQYNSKWLNNPQFVGSFEAGEFVYFVFRETAVEYINCGKAVYSRIARVCKSDPGGEHILKDNWTSFLKARLNCSIPGEYPFYFNEVQGITYSAESNILYATFTTPINSVHGSAVCAYNISAINLAFSGPFKYQENIGSTWESVDTSYRSHFECKSVDGPVSARHNHLLESSRYQMMDKAIQPTTSNPLYISQLERLSHISLDIVSTKFYLDMHVLYVATESGLVKKISVLPVTKKTCVIEMWQPEESSSIGIHVMQFLKGTESLYIGTEKSFLKIPAQHCKRHVSKASCLNAMDPYCGWDELKEACTPPPRALDTLEYWIQNATDCPILTAPIDGGWSSWSDWFKCAQSNDLPSEDFASNVDSCLCRKRTCNNPSPKNGGKSCKGIDIAVMNCTVNGGWTEWSAWSACSQTCGVAVKTRRRTCGNPKPAHGGRVCVGPDRSEIYCSHLPPCPVPKQTPIDGGWGPWGSWGECSSQCGGGFKIRRRKCNDPEPQNGGLDCSGCHIEYELCNTHPCPEMKKLSSWTPWLTQINESANNNELTEKRFRFSCKAATTDSNSLRLSLYKEETRVCKNSTCLRSADNGDDIIWSEWSPCNTSCGGGQQFRVKLCDRTPCEGQTRMARACNMQPCAHWTNWSEWSLCAENGKQVRYRKCLIDNPSPQECIGNDFEESNCIPINEGIYHSSAFIWASLLGTALVFSILSIVCTYFFLKPKRIKNFKNEFKRSSNSPSYDSQPNAYSSLPTKDILEPKQKTKRQPSFNSGTVANRNLTNVHGTLVKANNIPSNHTPKALANNLLDCETGTIKRNSHGLNNHKTFRTIDDEKF